MRSVTEACEILDDIASPRLGRESYKSVLTRVTVFINRVGIDLGLLEEPIKFSRVDDIWAQRIKRPYADEMDALRAARDAKALGKARHEHKTILDRLAALEARLITADADFHRPNVDGLREWARDARGDDRADDSRGCTDART